MNMKNDFKRFVFYNAVILNLFLLLSSYITIIKIADTTIMLIRCVLVTKGVTVPFFFY